MLWFYFRPENTWSSPTLRLPPFVKQWGLITTIPASLSQTSPRTQCLIKTSSLTVGFD